MKKILITLVWVILPLALIAGDKPFYGKISYNITYSGPDAEMLQMMSFTRYDYTFGDQKVRLKMDGGMVAAYMGDFIVNHKTNESYLIYDDEQTAYNLEGVEEEAAESEEPEPEPEVTVKKGTEKEKILGYKCQQYIVTTKTDDGEVVSEYWMTEDIRVDLRDGINMANSLSIKGIDGFPLKIVMYIDEVTVEQIATTVDDEKPDDSVFEVPEGYAVKPYSESPIMKMGAE